MTVNLLTEQNLEFLSLNGGHTGSSEPALVKMPHCWKPHVVAQLLLHPKLYILPYRLNNPLFVIMTLRKNWSQKQIFFS